MKLLLILPIMLITAVIVTIISQHSRKKNETTDTMLCPNCRTGRDSYVLDSSSEICPYISCLKNGKCKKYIPLTK